MPPKKNQDSNPTRNAVTLYSILLFSGQPYSLKRLSEILDCSRQSVMRLLEQIEMTGRAHIHKWTDNGQSYYQIKTPPSRPRTIISPKELEQLVLCKEWLQHLLPEGIRKSLDSTVEKAAVLLEDYDCRAEALQPIGESAVKGWIDYSGHEFILTVLAAAARTHHVVEVEYQSPQSDTPKTHCIVPGRIIAFHEALYVRGWKVTPKGTPKIVQPITLAIHRLREATPTRRHLSDQEMKSQPLLDETQFFGMAQQSDPFPVKARFYFGGATYVRERQWSKDCQLIPESDGSVTLCFMAQSELEVIKWILSFGAEAQLLEPEYLRKQVREELDAARKLYSA